MPPDQNASQTRSILLFKSPVITGLIVVSEGVVVCDMADLLRPASPGNIAGCQVAPTELVVVATRPPWSAIGDRTNLSPLEPTMTDHINSVSERIEALMTIEEVAEILRMPVASLRYWRVLGTGPRGFLVGRRLRYRSLRSNHQTCAHGLLNSRRKAALRPTSMRCIRGCHRSSPTPSMTGSSPETRVDDGPRHRWASNDPTLRRPSRSGHSTTPSP